MHKAFGDSRRSVGRVMKSGSWAQVVSHLSTGSLGV
jgi:hypothetical protein